MGRFAVRSRLGSGGMGEVYVAKDLSSLANNMRLFPALKTLRFQKLREHARYYA